MQPVFLRELVNYQREHPDDVCASLYWQTAASLDLEEFPLEDLLEAQKTAQSILEVGSFDVSCQKGMSGLFLPITVPFRYNVSG